jgi:hypothetical protein
MKARKSLGMDGSDIVKSVFRGAVGEPLSMNECEHAADTSTARVGSRRWVPMLEGCHLFLCAPLEPSPSNAAPRRLRQQFAENKTNHIADAQQYGWRAKRTT